MITRSKSSNDYYSYGKELNQDSPYLDIPCLGVAEIVVYFPRVNSFTCVVEGTVYDNFGVNPSLVFPVASVLSTAGSFKPMPSNTTITPSANNFLRIKPAGFSRLRIRRTGGDASAQFFTSPIAQSTDVEAPITPSIEKSVTFVVDTAIYASGDLLSNPIEMTNCARFPGGGCWITNLKMSDDDNEAAAMDVLILNAGTSLGTFNVAAALTDAMHQSIVWQGAIAATDWKDYGTANSVFTKENLPAHVHCAAGQTSLWIALISKGTPTYTAAGDLKALVEV